jgi:hypothetical protein
MSKLIIWVSATVGSSIGWWAGQHFGTMTAFLLSIVGTGVGIWAGRRAAVNVGV